MEHKRFNYSKLETCIRRKTQLFGEWLSNRKYTIYLALLILTTAGIICITCASPWRNTELSTFPFLSQVWGDAASWAAFVVSMGAVILVFRTYRSQLKVQLYHQAQVAIELQKYIPEIMPELSLLETKPGMSFHSHNLEQNSINIELEGPLTNIRNDAYHVSWIADDHIHSLGGPNGTQRLNVWKKNDKRFFNIMANSIPLRKDDSGVVYKILFKYEDRLKNQYEQALKFTCDFHPEIPATGPPEKDRPRRPSHPRIVNTQVSFDEPLLVKPYFPIV